MTIGTHCDPKSSSAELRAASHELARGCQRLPELVPEVARAQMHLKRKFLHKVYVRLVWPKYRYRPDAIGPGYLLVPLVWSGGTRRPHIGLGQQINFNSHFWPKNGSKVIFAKFNFRKKISPPCGNFLYLPPQVFLGWY